MANPLSKGWKYLKASFDNAIDENADPKIQIQQAVDAAKKQHRDIAQQAAQIIGNRNQLEIKLDRLVKEQDQLQNNARSALQAADNASNQGNAAKAQEFTQSAEVFATRLVTVEQEIEDTKRLHQQAEQSATQAQQQVKQSEAHLQEQLQQIDQLRAQVDQTVMQEKTTEAMDSMKQFTDDDSTPTLDAVRDKIERRYANALGAQELTEHQIGDRMLDVAQSGRDMKAASRLAEIRASMGLDETSQLTGSSPSAQIVGSGGAAGEAVAAKEVADKADPEKVADKSVQSDK